MPTDAVSGSVIQFQNAAYPLPAMLMPPAHDSGSGTLPAVGEIHDAAKNGDVAKVNSAWQALFTKCKPSLGKPYSEWPDERAEVSGGFREWKAQHLKAGSPVDK